MCCRAWPVVKYCWHRRHWSTIQHLQPLLLKLLTAPAAKIAFPRQQSAGTGQGMVCHLVAAEAGLVIDGVFCAEFFHGVHLRQTDLVNHCARETQERLVGASPTHASPSRRLLLVTPGLIPRFQWAKTCAWELTEPRTQHHSLDLDIRTGAPDAERGAFIGTHLAVSLTCERTIHPSIGYPDQSSIFGTRPLA